LRLPVSQPKFSSLDQNLFDTNGFTSKGRGACLVGENNSFSRVPNPPKPSTQPVESLLFRLTLRHRTVLENSPTFPQNPSPYSEGKSVDFTSLRIFTGRSKRNCFRFEPKVIRHQYRRPTEPGQRVNCARHSRPLLQHLDVAMVPGEH